MILDKCDVFDFQNILKELKEAKILYKTMQDILDNFFDGIIICDNSGYILDMNKACRDIIGVNKKYIIGKNIKNLKNEGIIFTSAILQVLETGKQVTLEEFKADKKIIVTSILIEETGIIVTILRDIEKILEKDDEKLELKKEQNIVTQGIVANSRNMISVLNKANKVAKLDVPVMIIGECGTGKSMLAEYIHKNSLRCNEKVIKINCGNLQKDIFKLEHNILKVGYKGSILIEEIGNLSMDMQRELLSLMKDERMDLRVITCTSKDLKDMMIKGLFLRELYYMLNVFPIVIEPIRKRKKDILYLANYFLKELNEKYNENKSLAPCALKIMLKYNWQGNVREIKNVVYRAFISSGEVIFEKDLLLMETMHKVDIACEEFSSNIDLKEMLEKIEFDFINRSFYMYGNVRDAAKSLNMDASTFVRKRKKYKDKYII